MQGLQLCIETVLLKPVSQFVGDGRIGFFLLAEAFVLTS